MNFNDFGNALVTLFVLMVVNNWFLIADMFANITGVTFAQFYFIAFYLLSVVLVLNIVVAFAIDMYCSMEELYNERSKTRAQKEEDGKRRFHSSSRSASSEFIESLDERDRSLDFQMNRRTSTEAFRATEMMFSGYEELKEPLAPSSNSSDHPLDVRRSRRAGTEYTSSGSKKFKHVLVAFRKDSSADVPEQEDAGNQESI